MTGSIKSGKELLDQFFMNLEQIDGVDKGTAATLTRLYKEGKLTDTNISNELGSLREGRNVGEVKRG